MGRGARKVPEQEAQHRDPGSPVLPRRTPLGKCPETRSCRNRNPEWLINGTGPASHWTRRGRFLSRDNKAAAR